METINAMLEAGVRYFVENWAGPLLAIAFLVTMVAAMVKAIADSFRR